MATPNTPAPRYGGADMHSSTHVHTLEPMLGAEALRDVKLTYKLSNPVDEQGRTSVSPVLRPMQRTLRAMCPETPFILESRYDSCLPCALPRLVLITSDVISRQLREALCWQIRVRKGSFSWQEVCSTLPVCRSLLASYARLS